MKLHELKPAEGSRKVRNRVGRGTSSGNGKTSGRGQKGQKAQRWWRTSRDLKVDKLHCSVVFQNVDSLTSTLQEYALVNLDQLNVFEDGTEVTPAVLKEAGNRSC